MKYSKKLNFNSLSINIIKWLKEYAVSSGAKGFVIGVSGGVDSAVVSTLVAETGLNVLVLSMPINQSTKEHSIAAEHIEWLQNKYSNVEFMEVNLSDAYNVLHNNYCNTCDVSFDNKNNFSVFGEKVSLDEFEFSMANTRSRLRMTTLYQYAGMHSLLVAGTGNKIEDFGIGFFTKYGDGGVDISPIGDLMKSEVYALGRELGVIESILTAAPTDGLHEDGRTDEQQLGCTYDELEEAMKFYEASKFLSTYSSATLTDRQHEVLNIYTKRHKGNLHKMTPIPVFNTYTLRI